MTTYLWNGSELAVFDNGARSSYSYNSDGIRTDKVREEYGQITETVHYVLDGSTIVSETRKDGYGTVTHQFYYYYDENGAPIGLNWNGQDYYYYKNIFGDILGIFNSSGTLVVRYSYDAWGCNLGVTGTMATTLGRYNPFRYRGYYYDTESGMYYLNARYYRPSWCRFISPDPVLDASNAVGCNLFAYCGNDPINRIDPTGEIAISTLILVGSIVLGCSAAAYVAYDSYKSTGTVNWVDATFTGLSVFATVYTAGMSIYGLYLDYSYASGQTPVTNIGPTQKSNNAPYANLQDPKNVAPGKDFTASQKQQIIEQNMKVNGGVVRSDLSGQILTRPSKSMPGITPSPYEWQVDHIIPRSLGGTNSFSNAQVLSRIENRTKWKWFYPSVKK